MRSQTCRFRLPSGRARRSRFDTHQRQTDGYRDDPLLGRLTVVGRVIHPTIPPCPSRPAGHDVSLDFAGTLVDGGGACVAVAWLDATFVDELRPVVAGGDVSKGDDARPRDRKRAGKQRT